MFIIKFTRYVATLLRRTFVSTSSITLSLLYINTATCFGLAYRPSSGYTKHKNISLYKESITLI